MSAKTIEELKELAASKATSNEEAVACALVIIAERLEWMFDTLAEMRKFEQESREAQDNAGK